MPRRKQDGFFYSPDTFFGDDSTMRDASSIGGATITSAVDLSESFTFRLSKTRSKRTRKTKTRFDLNENTLRLLFIPLACFSSLHL